LDEEVNLPPVLKDAEIFFKEKELSSFVLHSGKTTEWRDRAKLAVRGDFAHPIIGLFKEGSHEAISIPFCRVHHPRINETVDLLRSFIQSQKIAPYNEMSGGGDLRYLQIVIEKRTGKVQLSLVLNHQKVTDFWKTFIYKIFESRSDFWHSIWINLNASRTNTIFGTEWILCEGDEWLWEKIGRVNVCFQPSSFAQANGGMFEKLILQLESQVPLGARVVEFYAGGGAIGLNLMHKSEWVRCCEINPHAKLCFDKTCEKLSLDQKKKISFEIGDAGKNFSLIKGATVAVVDPPRKGLDRGLIKALNESKELETLFYVSCGWPSFKKNCDSLLLAGWSLESAEGYLFFPGSNHIETLAVFKRR
jgi:tRNA/tmRNA/rRNA uracil-C5-methylase (TrmA/RlmC/RlmD family)